MANVKQSQKQKSNLLANVSKAARIGSEEEEVGAVKPADVPSLSVASLELTPSSPMCEDCEFFQVDSDVDSCGSDVSVVSSPVLASCDAEMFHEELGLPERGKRSESVEQHGVCLFVCSGQYSQPSVKPQSRMAAGFWQGWQICGASSSSWDEGKWDNKCQEMENGVNEFTRVVRSEVVVGVIIPGAQSAARE